MEMICGQADRCGAMILLCVLYDFQTLITGAVAIFVAIIAGVPVWRQLRDTNLQTRISHRETLATLLRDALSRFESVSQSIGKPLLDADRMTSDPIGEPAPINPHVAHHLEQMLRGVLDWYLVVLVGTEHPDIETRKAALAAALNRLVDTLCDAHWAEHNDQHDENHSYSDAEWEEIESRCEEAKVEAAVRVREVQRAYRDLRQAQDAWAQSLRNAIAKLDLEIAMPRKRWSISPRTRR